ncbi:MAG: ankyrin repeat domain-containing protein [Akkermansiaceae bacterium]|jgi:uncharacterized protein|nr:ankyrin repeat domain-containing protein [Akkermansiaceae bacterium]MDP4647720.1 ankyrin repeat domain-containing protein [Akkermansiaceae bacterium]MDP4722219.1 ankyrin repeat domain-containing protein [Akkermansiaceae bacterium]MDP4780260.1 ankyrin repeat domain-containing protein [Akkermansiaceae bacterium]MDP4846257.1 ankyrin repeat domain-containing protein [Akkermansiaceae bacterium]
MIRCVFFLIASLATTKAGLIDAAYSDDTTAVTELLKSGADPSEKNRYGVTPLALACTNGNPEMVKALITAGADIHATMNGGETALMIAARTGDNLSVTQLLTAGAEHQDTDRKKQTAIMWASAAGHTDVVKTLIAAGADFKSPLPSGFTPIFFAVRAGHTETVQALLAAGADVKAVSKEKGRGRNLRNGTSAFILAVENGHLDLALDLIEAGADPNDMRSGASALHSLVFVRKTESGDSINGTPPPPITGNIDTLSFVKELVKRGADPNLRLNITKARAGARLNRSGATPFFLASHTDDLPLLRTLVEVGADPTIPNSDGTTPLMAAAGVGIDAPGEDAGSEKEALECVAYLLELGADINAVDKNDETAMHGAAYKGLPKMIRYLDSQGADIKIWNKENKRGWSPLVITQGYRFGNFRPIAEAEAALAEVMLSHGVTPPPASDYKGGSPGAY